MKKEDILKFYSKYKLFIFPISVAFSSLLLIGLVILPQTIKLIANQKTGSEMSSKSQFLEAKAQELEIIDEEDLSKKVEYALNIYPADRDFGNAVGVIQRISTQTGFNIVSLNVGGSSIKGGAQNYTITLQLVGSKSLIPTILNALENGPRLMKVESIAISQSAGTQGVEINLGLNVLFSPIPQNFGTVDSPLPQLSQKEERLLVKLAGAQEKTGIIQSKGEEFVPASPKGKANPFE